MISSLNKIGRSIANKGKLLCVIIGTSASLLQSCTDNQQDLQLCQETLQTCKEEKNLMQKQILSCRIGIVEGKLDQVGKTNIQLDSLISKIGSDNKDFYRSKYILLSTRNSDIIDASKKELEEIKDIAQVQDTTLMSDLKTIENNIDSLSWDRKERVQNYMSIESN